MNIRYLILRTPKKVNLHRLKKDNADLTVPQRKMKRELHLMRAEYRRMSGARVFDDKILWVLRINRGLQGFIEFLAEHAPAWEVLLMYRIKKQLVTETIDGDKVPVLDAEGGKQYETVNEHKNNASDLIIQQHLIKRKDKKGVDIEWVKGEEILLPRHDNACGRANYPRVFGG